MKCNASSLQSNWWPAIRFRGVELELGLKSDWTADHIRIYTYIRVSEADMATHKTKTFKSGNSQAVRLPKALAFPDGTELEIVRKGDVVTMRPAKLPFHEMLQRLRELPSPDYVEVRDTEEIPDRPGL